MKQFATCLLLGGLLMTGATSDSLAQESGDRNHVVFIHGWDRLPDETYGEPFENLIDVMKEKGGWTDDDYTLAEHHDEELGASLAAREIERVAYEVAERYFWPALADNGDRPIDVVCHSMGGLIARTIMAGRDYNEDGESSGFPADKINRLITVGTPHYGQNVPKWYTGSDTQRFQMYAGGRFLWNLAGDWKKTPSSRKQQTLCIAGYAPLFVSDLLVPVWAAGLEESPTRFIWRSHGAGSLLKCEDDQDAVYRAIVAFLTQGAVLDQSEYGANLAGGNGAAFIRVLDSASNGVVYQHNVVQSPVPLPVTPWVPYYGQGASMRYAGSELLGGLNPGTYRLNVVESADGRTPAFTSSERITVGLRSTIVKTIWAPDSTAPRILYHLADSTPDTDVAIKFGPDRLDPSTFQNNVTIVGSASGNRSFGTIYDEANHTLTLDPSGNFSYGETVTVTTTAGVKDMAGNALSTPMAYSFPISHQRTFTVTTAAGSNGSISPSGTRTVSLGGSLQLTANPSSGYEIDGWYLDGNRAQSGGNTYTLSNVGEIRTAYVSFRRSIATTVALNKPNGGDIWGQQDRLPIEWDWHGPIGGQVKIELLKGGSVHTVVDASYDNTGAYHWRIPRDQEPGDDYTVRVSDLDGSPSVESGEFEIAARITGPVVKRIGTLADLRDVSENWGQSGYPADGTYLLTADIDARDTRSDPIDPFAVDSTYAFRGLFDGQGYKITGLDMDRAGEPFAGLFGVVRSSGHIKNLTIEWDDLIGGGYQYWGPNDSRGGVGGIAAESAGTIENCHVSADRAHSMNGDRVGGIVGDNVGTIINCTVYGDTEFEGRRDNNSDSPDKVGGIAGLNTGLIRWCVVDSNVDVVSDSGGSEGDEAGGIAGRNAGDIIECAAHCRLVKAEFYSGGIVGYQEDDGSVIDCFYTDGEIDGDGHKGGIAGRNNGVVRRSWMGGQVDTTGSNRGSLAGSNYGTIERSYWDTGAVNLPISGNNGGTVTSSSGKTASQMNTESTFSTWDFDEVWNLTSATGFPRLLGAGESLSTPTSLTASTGFTDGVRLSWSAPTGATYYKVYRSDTDDGGKLLLSSGWSTSRTFVDASAFSNATYYYCVKAAITDNGAGESDYSQDASGSRLPPPLDAPTTFAVTEGMPGSVVLDWSLSVGASHYRVYRAPVSGGAAVAVSEWVSERSFTDIPPQSRTSYTYYVVAAADDQGAQASSQTQTVVGSFVPTDHDAPTVQVDRTPALPTSDDDLEVDIDVADDDRLERVTLHWRTSSAQSTSWTSLSVASLERTHSLGTFAAGTEVAYWVEAVDASGNSTTSPQANVVVQAPPPPQLHYSGFTLRESTHNDGTIENELTIRLVGDTFATSLVSAGHVRLQGVPAGLTPVITRQSADTVTIGLSGAADLHREVASDDVSITFADAAFATLDAAGVIASGPLDVAVAFEDEFFLVDVAVEHLEAETFGTPVPAFEGPVLQFVRESDAITPLRAVPPEGWHFVEWKSGGTSIGMDADLAISDVNENISLTAVFEINRYEVRFVTDGERDAQLTGELVQTVPHGWGTSEVHAVPPRRRAFHGWSGSISGVQNPLTISPVTSGMTLTANFGKANWPQIEELEGYWNVSLNGTRIDTESGAEQKLRETAVWRMTAAGPDRPDRLELEGLSADFGEPMEVVYRRGVLSIASHEDSGAGIETRVAFARVAKGRRLSLRGQILLVSNDLGSQAVEAKVRGRGPTPSPSRSPLTRSGNARFPRNVPNASALSGTGGLARIGLGGFEYGYDWLRGRRKKDRRRQEQWEFEQLSDSQIPFVLSQPFGSELDVTGFLAGRTLYYGIDDGESVRAGVLRLRGTPGRMSLKGSGLYVRQLSEWDDASECAPWRITWREQ